MGLYGISIRSGNSVAAKKVLLTLWDYMSTPDQIKRMQDVISNPKGDWMEFPGK